MSGLDSSQPYIIKVRDVMSPEECLRMIERIESLGPEVATINTFAGAMVNRDVRNNDRVMFDDQELADEILARVRHRAPETFLEMKLAGANERFRCYRYQPGMRFAPHADGAFHRSSIEQSCYSCLIYLNEEFEGGATTFLTEPEVAIQPERGMALLFQHPIIHEGSVVTKGTKYVCRTDLMYRQPIGESF
ncbi:prolyl hydroxylase family protein [Calycomorphotria hydatis]|uniref:Fe(II)-dependent oxygenase superfamily protein n=1 Tax=Calycomorphotria hydatis TaxID=2528027 RepID=A0A517T7R9_9PLAN|nr:2OG-Fe(II) oxygenase [Calycomorphotria hydatis]QDT64421.1 Fe(II)-dependent oxygenase superfamily protein [Calycomorphotria hydatis]